MKFNIINNNNIYLLKQFIKFNNSKTFRYFNKRNIDVINNHLITIILTNDKDIIGYGHLDFENKVWLGICVNENFRGGGYGTKIIKYLIDYAEKNQIENIYLTVDKENIVAKKFYEKHNFFIEKENDNIFFMYKKIDIIR